MMQWLMVSKILYFDLFSIIFVMIYPLASIFWIGWGYGWDQFQLNNGKVIEFIYRRKFRSQTSDNMDRWKAEQGRAERREESRREKISRRERVRRKKIQMREKVGKSRNTVFFPMICGSGGSKSRLAKAAGAEPSGQMRDEKLHAVVMREAHFEVKKVLKHLGLGPLLEVEMSKKCTPLWREAHFEVARKCQHVQNTPGLGPLLEVEMSKKCTPLWREAHFEVKMYKAPQGSDHFWRLRCEKVHAVVARSTLASQNVQSTQMVGATFGSSRCWKSARRHVKMLRSTFPSQNVQDTHMFIRPLLEVQEMIILRLVANWEHQIFRSAEMILRRQMQHFVST